MSDAVDPDTVEVVRNRFVSIAEEMQATVMNSAYAPLWQESGDLSCAVLSPNCEIVGQSERVIPIHVATMTNTVRAAIEGTGGYDELREGDVLIQNDPYSGNSHMPDVAIAKPVFVDGVLVGIAAVRAHWIDIGGSVPGSYPIDNRELFAEGLRIPPEKLYRGGERNETIVNLLEANIRNSEDRFRDLKAQLAGVRRGESQIAALAERYGAETTTTVAETILSNAEERMRRTISALPDGRYHAEDRLDSRGVAETPPTIRGTVVIDGSDIVVDFAGTDDQIEAGINAPISATEAATFYAVKVNLDPGDPGTLGAYRPISVRAPEGSLVNPIAPAPVAAANHETSNRVFDVVVRALSEVDPDLGFAAGEGSASVVLYQSMESGKMNITCQPGGMGACTAKDGVNAIRSGIGNTGIQPVERTEETFPFVRIEETSIPTDTGGAGRQAGGNALRRVLRFTDDVELTLVCERAESQPYGLRDGDPGASSEHVYVAPDGTRTRLPSKISTQAEAGSRLIVQTAGGGGYGDPSGRSPEQVVADVRKGYVSRETAQERYGVVIDPETGELDRAATDSLGGEK